MGAVFYGLIFYGAALLLGLNSFTLPMCLMFGSIVAPTDPIAATSILKKFGLPKNVSFLIESESLFNDGVGVALFACFSGMVAATGAGESAGFIEVMLTQVLGASFVRVFQMPDVIALSCVAIVGNLISRVGGLAISSLIMGELPDNYDRLNFVKLFTWGGLRGGLSVALALSTRSFLPDDTFYIIIGGTFAVVFFTTVVQGLTMKPAYERIAASVSRRQQEKA